MVMLRWWFLVVAELVGFTAAGLTGALHKLWAADVTHLSIICLFVLVLSTGFIGWITYQLEIADDTAWNHEQVLARMKLHANACWFTSEALMGIGMVGTIFGFLIMLNDAFTGSMQAQEVMLRAAPGLGTMCVTTAVGLICSMFVKAQLTNLEYLVPSE